jgi:hypothetical protein
MARLHLVKPASASVFTFQNRMGDMYYLHEGRTKTGKPRYFFAKTAGQGTLAEMPKGFEVSESINGVVSVRRTNAGGSVAPDEDVRVVEAAVGRHAHLRGYMVRALGNAVVIFEPHPRPDKLRDLAQQLGFAHRAPSFVEDRMKQAQYAPVMKFEPEGDGYVAFRMTYRGKGGWSWPLQSGKLHDLASKLVPSVGTEAFFDLI